MSSGEIIISVVTAVLVVFSVVVSIVIPGRDPNFPGRRNLLTFTIVCLVLVGGTLAAVEVFGGEEGAEAAEVAGEGEPGADASPREGDGVEPGPGDAEPPPPGEESGESPPPAGDAGDPVVGSGIYDTMGCGGCHVLADAGSTGAIGPNLDESASSFELVVDRVTNGGAGMPPFGSQLSAAEIDDVAAYVVAATSG